MIINSQWEKKLPAFTCSPGICCFPEMSWRDSSVTGSHQRYDDSAIYLLINIRKWKQSLYLIRTVREDAEVMAQAGRDLKEFTGGIDHIQIQFGGVTFYLSSVHSSTSVPRCWPLHHPVSGGFLVQELWQTKGGKFSSYRGGASMPSGHCHEQWTSSQSPQNAQTDELVTHPGVCRAFFHMRLE